MVSLFLKISIIDSKNIFVIVVYFSGNVVTMECVEKLIKPDMVCPITGQKLKESDIIIMERVSCRILSFIPVTYTYCMLTVTVYCKGSSTIKIYYSFRVVLDLLEQEYSFRQKSMVSH